MELLLLLCDLGDSHPRLSCPHVRARLLLPASPADSGVDCAHPDLNQACVAGAAFNRGAASYGLTAARDSYGHGTYIAGAVAAAGDGKGTAGLMYGGVALYVCRFIDAQGYGTTADALLCLDWCMQKGATVSSEPPPLLPCL
jgi:subtilisin family serine protease